jgi:hypothetical protein
MRQPPRKWEKGSAKYGAGVAKMNSTTQNQAGGFPTKEHQEGRPALQRRNTVYLMASKGGWNKHAFSRSMYCESDGRNEQAPSKRASVG